MDSYTKVIKDDVCTSRAAIRTPYVTISLGGLPLWWTLWWWLLAPPPLAVCPVSGDLWAGVLPCVPSSKVVSFMSANLLASLSDLSSKVSFWKEPADHHDNLNSMNLKPPNDQTNRPFPISSLRNKIEGKDARIPVYKLMMPF